MVRVLTGAWISQTSRNVVYRGNQVCIMTEWLKAGMGACCILIEWWMNEDTSVCCTLNEWMNAGVSVCCILTEWMKAGVSVCCILIEWVKAGVSFRILINEWLSVVSWSFGWKLEWVSVLCLKMKTVVTFWCILIEWRQEWILYFYWQHDRTILKIIDKKKSYDNRRINCSAKKVTFILRIFQFHD